MREFVVLGHTAPIEPGYSLDDLAGGAGRLDVLCRCVTAGLLVSHGIREDARVWLCLRGALAIRFEGAELRHLSPDERSTASLIAHALAASDRTVGHAEVESTPGIYVSKRDVETVLRSAADRGPLVHLDVDGTPITSLSPPPRVTFVLSDHQPFTAAERELLDELADHRVSLGPVALHADQAITIAHNYFDTGGWPTD